MTGAYMKLFWITEHQKLKLAVQRLRILRNYLFKVTYPRRNVVQRLHHFFNDCIVVDFDRSVVLGVASRLSQFYILYFLEVKQNQLLVMKMESHFLDF
jgi:hypothetical protein